MPVSTEHAALFKIIYDQLVIVLCKHPHVLIDMHTDHQDNGPAAFNWLMKRFNPTSQVTHVRKLMGILEMGIDTDNDIQKMQTANSSLPAKLQCQTPPVWRFYAACHLLRAHRYMQCKSA